MKTLTTRVREDNIRAEATMTDKPLWADFGANWYAVTLRRKGRRLTVPFGMGEALTDEPTAEDVLNCLLSDAAGYENASSFEDWADEYGYDADSRKAERTYKQVEAQTAKLRKFLADDFEEYVWNTESL